jgi:hypothetical protein
MNSMDEQPTPKNDSQNELDAKQVALEYQKLQSNAKVYLEMHRICEEELWKKVKSVDRLIGECDRMARRPNVKPQRKIELLKKQYDLLIKARAYQEIIKTVHDKLGENNPAEEIKAFKQKYRLDDSKNTDV